MSRAASETGERSLFRRLLGERPDETLLRAVFRTLVAATVVVLGADLFDAYRAEQAEAAAPKLVPGELPKVQPFLPSTRPKEAPGDEKRRGSPMDERLQQAMTIDLLSGGRLEAKGAITPGTAARFAEEIAKRGDYVKTVVLNSPGGSVQDALAMGKLIREKGLSTRVESGGHCASSCPLVFSGGVERVAEKGASIGVHQVFALQGDGAPADTGMAQAQRVSAECQRHLVDMGVDTRVWIHAMETPREELFYFTDKELLDLKLATGEGSKAEPTAAAPRRPRS
jgi:hypothetical protein